MNYLKRNSHKITSILCLCAISICMLLFLVRINEKINTNIEETKDLSDTTEVSDSSDMIYMNP